MKTIKYQGEWGGGWACEDSLADSGDFTMEISVGEDGAFIGETQDMHGTASVFGVLTESSIIFQKIYSRDASKEAIKTTIYKGYRDFGAGTSFKGLWCPDYAFGHREDELHYEFMLLEIA